MSEMTERDFVDQLDEILESGAADDLKSVSVLVSFGVHRRVEMFCCYNPATDAFRYCGRDWLITSRSTHSGESVEVLGDE